MFYRLIRFGLILLFFLVFIINTVVAEQPSFDFTARSAILMEYQTGEVLYEKNPDLKLPPASMTKLMTMLLVMEALENEEVSLDDKIVVSELAASMGGSQIWLEPGEEMTLQEMLKAIAIVSANDACVAVAEYLCGTEEDFVKRMNERARELGLENTYYYNTNGLPPDDSSVQGTYTSARDLATLARELLKHQEILSWTSTWIDYLRNGESVLNNTNRLVRHYNGADGLKTGFTEEAGFCVTSTAERNGLRFISVIMGAESSNKRFDEAGQLLTFGFGSFEAMEIAAKDQVIVELEIRNGKEEKTNGVVLNEIIVPVKRGEKDNINREIVLNKKIIAPLKKGDKVGEVKVYKGNLLLKAEDIVVDRDVAKASFFQLILRLIKHIISSLLSLLS